MGLVSFLALALFVAIASLVILDGRGTNMDHQQVVIAMNEPVPSSLKPRSSLRNLQWWTARIVRWRQGSLPHTGPVYGLFRAGVLRGAAGLAKGFDYFAARSASTTVP